MRILTVRKKSAPTPTLQAEAGGFCNPDGGRDKLAASKVTPDLQAQNETILQQDSVMTRNSHHARGFFRRSGIRRWSGRPNHPIQLMSRTLGAHNN